jgi:alkanesulfonate monooxygenase SsuD/methylene tetrahydromethanopterin reductase-like flavin-dependent oxidoreductase (luciferase family)
MAATLDTVSPGRVIVGLGAGGSDADAAAFRVQWPPVTQRIEALAEAAQVMRILWAMAALSAVAGTSSGMPPPTVAPAGRKTCPS